MGEALVIRDIRVSYGQREALCGLDAEFPHARVTAILGPGGSGKSTLLRVLAGASPELRCSGEVPSIDAWLLPQAARTHARLAPDPELVANARAELEAWLAEHPTTLPHTQREALLAHDSGVVRTARIVAAEAEVLLLDEPDDMLTGDAGLAFAGLLRALADTGRTIILVTHNLALVDRVADHVLLLVDGVKLDEGPLARVRAHPASNRVREFFTWGA